MMRRMTLALVLMCLCASSVQAGLQSALRTALTGLQAADTHIDITTPAPWIPEGALFIDPLTSTRGEGVFREGPDFHYDATSGAVTVSIPPMLGPADEFGLREQYSPTSLRIVAGDYWADSPSIPELTKYRRNTARNNSRDWWQVPSDENAASFVIDEESDNFDLSVSSNVISVSTLVRYGLGGAEVSFSQLLSTGLDPEVFAADEEHILPNSIWPLSPYAQGALPLPDVYFIVDYSVNDYGIRIAGYNQYSLLAVPWAGTFASDQTQVPEPNSLLLGSLAITALMASWRNRHCM